ncbi:MAG: cytochrome c [Gammaproteobacteria bacterium]|nr:cytochrome c [Gammaproteobacteria bacterium]
MLAMLILVGFYTSSGAQTPSLGTPVSPSQLSGFDLIVEPDGTGLPAGSGTAAEGENVFRARCQACHGANGEGNSSSTVLVGGSMQSEGPPLRTVGSYWPHATTVFDFIRRAMPADAPKSLSDEEVYQVTAYVLFLNEIVGRDEVLNARSLPLIDMPNSDGFIDQSHIQ